MDVLCTDKTGTLTEAKIIHVGSFGPDGANSTHVTDLARLNGRFASGVRSSLDDAILFEIPPFVGGVTCLDDLPFDFERRRSSVLVLRANVRTMITKGAPEGLLPFCTKVETADGSIVPLDDATRLKIGELFEGKDREGFRLLGVAWREIGADGDRIGIGDERDLVFAGCAAFLDPPKASATRAVNDLIRGGVCVKIVSGDAGPVVLYLVNTLALPARGLLSGDEMPSVTDAALTARVTETDIFVRISPDRALRRNGYTVGFLGDGINDAPAIHVADVGVSVDGGTDVARAAADIILLAPELGVLAAGVAECRRTYANIMKYVRMGTRSNFGNMLSMALASLVLPFLPLTSLQILLNNLIYDISEIGIPFDRADENELLLVRRIHRDADSRHFCNWHRQAFMGKPPPSCACGDFAWGTRRSAHSGVNAAWRLCRVCSTAFGPVSCARRRERDLSRDGRAFEAGRHAAVSRRFIPQNARVLGAAAPGRVLS
jgi:Mg2+-importing ATPase